MSIYTISSPFFYPLLSVGQTLTKRSGSHSVAGSEGIPQLSTPSIALAIKSNRRCRVLSADAKCRRTTSGTCSGSSFVSAVSSPRADDVDYTTPLDGQLYTHLVSLFKANTLPWLLLATSFSSHGPILLAWLKKTAIVAVIAVVAAVLYTPVSLCY